MKRLFKNIFLCFLLVCFQGSTAQITPGMVGVMVSNAVACAYQTETCTYLTAEAAAGKTYTAQQELDIDTVFRDLKGLTNPRYTTYNVLSKITIIYPFYSGVSASDKVNMVNPGTYNYTETGSPTYSTSTYSVTFNGTSNYLNTTHTPNGSGSFAGSDFTIFAYHRLDNGTDVGGTMGEVGGGNSYMEILNAFYINIILCSKTAANEVTAQNSSRLWWASWSDSSTTNAYMNATNVETRSYTYITTPTRSLFIGGINNNGSIAYGGGLTVDFYIEGVGTWSNAEEAFMYNCFKRAKLDINGQTWN
jgi:hypothetical protein